MMDFEKWYQSKVTEHNQMLKSSRNNVHIVKPDIGKRIMRRIRKSVTLQESDSVDILKIRDSSAIRQPGSGCIDGMKGDSISYLDMCECKQTEKDFISIKMEWLRKIIQECCGLFPLLHIRFVCGFRKENVDWWMCPKRFFVNIQPEPSLYVETNHKSKVFYRNQFDGDIDLIEVKWNLLIDDNVWFILPQHYFIELIGKIDG